MAHISMNVWIVRLSCVCAIFRPVDHSIKNNYPLRHAKFNGISCNACWVPPFQYHHHHRYPFLIPRTWYLHCNSFRITANWFQYSMCVIFFPTKGKQNNTYSIFFCHRHAIHMSLLFFCYIFLYRFLFLTSFQITVLCLQRSTFSLCRSASRVSHKGFNCIFSYLCATHLQFAINFSYILLWPNLVFHLLFKCLSSLLTIFFFSLPHFSAPSSFASIQHVFIHIYSSNLDCISKSLCYGK